MNEPLSKLALGSANFGLDYGVANKAGRVSNDALNKILSVAHTGGIQIIDTAQSYGNSEQQIGALHESQEFKIVTKFRADLQAEELAKNIPNLVQESCERLNRSSLYCIMLHRPEIILSEHGSSIIIELNKLKNNGIITKIGASIYSPNILENLSQMTNFDIIQAPFNIFDQRLLLSGWNERLKETGTEIHTRSTFLQGLLLLTQDELPEYFMKYWPDQFSSWFDFIKFHNVNALDTALNFVTNQPWVDKVVVGVDTAAQLASLIGLERSTSPLPCEPLACSELNLIDPSRWPKK